jgi:hypothetical protein
MTTTNNLTQKIEDELKKSKFTDESNLPPVDQWNPPFCGDIDIRIDKNGNWYYQGSIMKRQSLVNLFSRVIRLDEDNEYYLVTPSEKVRIKVDRAPFFVTEYILDKSVTKCTILFTTKTGDKIHLDKTHPLILQKEKQGESIPLVLVRRNLYAQISRPVFYQLIELAKEIETPSGPKWYIESNGERFNLG